MNSSIRRSAGVGAWAARLQTEVVFAWQQVPWRDFGLLGKESSGLVAFALATGMAEGWPCCDLEGRDLDGNFGVIGQTVDYIPDRDYCWA